MIVVENICKTYGSGESAVAALKHVDLQVKRGEFVAIMGPSGSGKSTLMNILGCLDSPTEGSYRLDGTEVAGMDHDELAEVRNRKIGFVFQSYNLIPRQEAYKQVMLPLLYNSESRDRESMAMAALERVGLADRVHHMPNELSGGQQQRVAIARCLANNPAIILGDEPTGNLDTRTSEEILAIFQDVHAEGRTIVMVTHEEDIASHAQRVLRFRDGHLVADEKVEHRLDARQVLKQLPVEDEQ